MLKAFFFIFRFRFLKEAAANGTPKHKSGLTVYHIEGTDERPGSFEVLQVRFDPRNHREGLPFIEELFGESDLPATPSTFNGDGGVDN